MFEMPPRFDEFSIQGSGQVLTLRIRGNLFTLPVGEGKKNHHEIHLQPAVLLNQHLPSRGTILSECECLVSTYFLSYFGGLKICCKPLVNVIIVGGGGGVQALSRTKTQSEINTASPQHLASFQPGPYRRHRERS